ncbi:hypothetical protein, conserved [Trypanosoma brucei gambiense DAL972]|uniref:CBF1-interacting co-repressor CIR N-terminal domain-containing protein n=1 Tax=Trypanosoma brucei gambiense (strain MHOM/CI/86/DAL972) TaxID=679716 RepID=D0A642_TRYB9|nr:LOW QUALITY PROTEIN: hypothetical protein, conserved [Trypanosoma brucei gambiense DAL972]CBH17143.1 hypothetical protein, conserved [Trypanosoma brucei gambiense DAL972]|eukprot:XP_011779407.1 LOW QUALITY PROTEIN: hypothetical protein, conserved [Trypanosoma brucei gambiense DAL972]
MYASHKKDINRHKSFHPLTFQNLSRVERGLEKEEEKKKAKEQRSAELLHDQEQRRYDDLVISASGDSIPHVLRSLDKWKIFLRQRRINPHCSRRRLPMGQKTSALTFQKDPLEAKKSTQKRQRDDVTTENEKGGSEGQSFGGAGRKEEERKVSGSLVTGFITKSDAVQLRKELDKLQKERHDPLRRVEQFQNRTVAAEAKRRALEARAASNNSRGDLQKDIIHSRLQELLDMKK